MMKKTALTLLISIFLPFAASAQKAPKYPPNLSEAGRQGYLAQYVKAPANKAFAVTRDGQKFVAIAGVDAADAAAPAVSAPCLSTPGVPCRLWMVNDQELYSRYAESAHLSSAAVAKLPPALAGKRFGEEEVEPQVEEPASLRAGNDIHGPTPLSGPAGSKVIHTDELVALYKSDRRLVVLDVLQSKALQRKMLPKANWIYGAGWEQAEVNANISRLLAPTMRALAPRKDTPIVTYCSNRDCWLSWNAALRLVQAGYKNVYWYRGGIEAWRAPELPLIQPPPYAPLRCPPPSNAP